MAAPAESESTRPFPRAAVPGRSHLRVARSLQRPRPRPARKGFPAPPGRGLARQTSTPPGRSPSTRTGHCTSPTKERPTPPAPAFACGSASPPNSTSEAKGHGPSALTGPRSGRPTGRSRSTPPPPSNCSTTSTPNSSISTRTTAPATRTGSSTTHGTVRGVRTPVRPWLEPRRQDRRHTDLPRTGRARWRAAPVRHQGPWYIGLASLEWIPERTVLAGALHVRHAHHARRGLHRLTDLHRTAAPHRPGRPLPHPPPPLRRHNGSQTAAQLLTCRPASGDGLWPDPMTSSPLDQGAPFSCLLVSSVSSAGPPPSPPR